MEYIPARLEPLDEAVKSKNYAEGVKKSLAKGIQHLIKWKVQPSRQSSSWAKTIDDAIGEISDKFNSDANNKNFKNVVYADNFDKEAFEMGKEDAKKDFRKDLKEHPERKAEVDKLIKEVNKLPFINAYSLDNFRDIKKTHQYMINNAENGAEKYVVYKEASDMTMNDLLEKRKNS